ncbi:stage V sporulation protein R [Cytophagales bacterium RKSG123]|nr:stage V sporulation protein R [Xanthovirga aplysinae]
MRSWTIQNLLEWNERIEEKARELGLDFYKQEFEICDYHDMLGYQSYMGMPARYPHWSFGKAFERLKTLYQHGLSGLSYEMVINTDPCLAYLMIDNPLPLQILTMAHVYGHNDFFKNNIHFSQSRADLALEMFKRHADRIRAYIEDPGIGYIRVERILDAAHAISMQCDRNILQKFPPLKAKEKAGAGLGETHGDQWAHLKKKKAYKAKSEVLLEKELLLYIRDHQPLLEDWEKDLLTIVWEENRYFLPQMETKIMNEGWATFWHYTILNQLDLDHSLYFDFIRSHNQVIRPHLGGINPYHIGYTIFSKLAGSDGHSIDYELDKKIFEVRTIDRDNSFLRRFLTEELARQLNLFEFQVNPENVKITEISDREGWHQVKETLIANIGTNAFPQVVVEHKENSDNVLQLVHLFDGRELQMKYLEETLKYVNTLWGNPVKIRTLLEGKNIVCECEEGKFRIIPD